MTPIETIRTFLASPLPQCHAPRIPDNYLPSQSSSVTMNYYQDHKIRINQAGVGDIGRVKDYIVRALERLSETAGIRSWIQPPESRCRMWASTEADASAWLLENALDPTERILNKHLESISSEYRIRRGPQESRDDERWEDPPTSIVDHCYFAYKLRDKDNLRLGDTVKDYKERVAMHPLATVELKKPGVLIVELWKKAQRLVATGLVTLKKLFGLECPKTVVAILPQLTKYMFTYRAKWNFVSDYRETLVFERVSINDQNIARSEVVLKMYHINWEDGGPEKISFREMVFFACLDALDELEGRSVARR